MATFKVVCKEKHSTYERIVAIGCVTSASDSIQRFSEDDAINRINKKIDNFYVERPAGHHVEVIVAEREGREYLKTKTDGEKPDNLLSLPDFPAKKPVTSHTGRTITAAASHGCE